MIKYYRLEGHEPIECKDVLEWGRWFGSADRVVAQTYFGKDKPEEIQVSTVFLGLDYSYGKGKPILFETMIFGGEHDQYQDRCSTWDQAIEMHDKAIKLVNILGGK